MRKLIGHAFFIWAVVYMTATGIIATLLYAVIFVLVKPHHKAFKYTHKVTQWWGYLVPRLALSRVKSIGRENIDPSQSYVIVSNHKSNLDIPICMETCPVPFSFLAKAEVRRIPFVGFLAANMHVLVKRDNPSSRKKSLQLMSEWVKSGKSIHIYPEGTRNTSNEPLKLPLYDGAFRLAIDTQRPLVVLTIVDSDKIMDPNYGFELYPFQVATAIWSPPIPTVGMTEFDVEKLKNQAVSIMMQYLSESKNTLSTKEL